MILFTENDTITDSHLESRGIYKKGKHSPTNLNLNIIEKEAVISALNQSGWNKVEAAKLLNIGRKALYNKIKKFEIEQR